MSIVTLQAVFVGLDYHAATVQVCVMTADGTVLLNRKCANDWRPTMAAVQERCSKAVQVQAAIESCCGAADLAAELISRGWTVQLAHPGHVARVKHTPDKTEYGDARLLAT